ncbi:YqaJ viral recombinase family protein [Planctomonas sp. JC2975]|uniref:YqaJ viral recombinase family protein n=1 Tax=Planctomonas sp. JC2975 TaxID=2729626 RepID=UPI003211DF45
MTDTMLSLFDEELEATLRPVGGRQDAVIRPAAVPLPPHERRILAHSSDRVPWLRARARGITATDVAKLSTPASVLAAARQKVHGSGFTGNVYTEHGKAREPQIAKWMLREHGIEHSDALFHAERDRRHLATPDGLALRDDGHLVLAEIKTTNKPWRSIPRHYLRQVWWQQYVLGAERTLFVWERHDGFVPVGDPECKWIDRDENEIEALVSLATQLIATLASGRV